MMTARINSMPVSLVTGANKGIGLETVRRLAGAGHRVYLAARDAQRGRAAAATLGARFVQLDVTCDDSVRHAAKTARVIHSFLPLLERSADPRIVNVSSGLASFALSRDESRTESRAPHPSTPQPSPRSTC